MPTTTTNLGLSQPIGSDPPSTLRSAIGGNAALMDAYSLLTSVVSNAGSASVLRGQSVVASSSTTQTLPATSAGAMVAIIAASTVTGATPVTVAGSNIFGVGLSAVSSFKLGTPGAFTILQSDGTNWYVVAGQQDTGWVALSLAANVGTAAGAFTPASRLQGDRVTLRGTLQNNTGGVITAGTTLATVTTGSRPTLFAQSAVGAGNGGTASLVVTVAASGVIATLGGNLSNAQTLGLDGVAFSLN